MKKTKEDILTHIRSVSDSNIKASPMNKKSTITVNDPKLF